MLGASVRPVAFRRAQAERLERRLQKVILDMRKSAPSPMRSDNADGMVLPHWSDYRYAMKKMSFLGWLSGSEGIYAEVKRFNWPLDIQRKLLYYRLASLTSWLRANTVHRITWRDGTTHVPLRVVRANEGEGEVSFKRVKGEQGEPRGPEELVGILRDSLKDLNADKSIRHGRTTDQLLEALRRMIAFLPSDQERLREATQQMLEEVLTRVHGLDLKYLTISPDSAVTRDVGSMVGVTNAVVDLLGSKGDVWRMVAAVDALGSGPDRLWSNSSWADEGESEEGWEDGSEVVMADAKRGGEGSRFLEEKGRSSKEIGKDAVDMVDAAGQAVETPSEFQGLPRRNSITKGRRAGRRFSSRSTPDCSSKELDRLRLLLVSDRIPRRSGQGLCPRPAGNEASSTSVEQPDIHQDVALRFTDRTGGSNAAHPTLCSAVGRGIQKRVAGITPARSEGRIEQRAPWPACSFRLVPMVRVRPRGSSQGNEQQMDGGRSEGTGEEGDDGS